MTSSEIDVSDTASIVTSESTGDGGCCGDGCRCRALHGCCRRGGLRVRWNDGSWFFVEPVLMAYSFNVFPMMIINQRYGMCLNGVNKGGVGLVDPGHQNSPDKT